MIAAAWILTLYIVHTYTSSCSHRINIQNERVLLGKASPIGNISGGNNRQIDQDDVPIIFVGGMPRSGTTLMRTMLDAHPEVRCGQETRVIPRLLFMRNNWIKSAKEKKRLEEAGVFPGVLDKAVRQFILEIIVHHGNPAKYLCNKDPFTLKATVYLHDLFPQAKFIFMLRDGRATAHSIISRKVTIAGFDINSYRDVLTKWNRAMELIEDQCRQVGTEYCLRVHYERLVLQPVATTKRIFKFLQIPWNENVLHHEKHLGNISLSNMEKSTDQVQRPLYLDALTSWFGHIPPDIERDMPKIAPMLKKFGYDPYNPRPSYGEPDEFIKQQLKLSGPT